MNYHSNIVSQHNLKCVKIEPYLSMLHDVDNIASIENINIDITNKLSVKLLETRSIEELNKNTTQYKTIAEFAEFDCYKVIKNKDTIKETIMKVLCDSLFIPFTIIQWIETSCNHCTILKWNKCTIHILDDKCIEEDLIKDVIKIVKWMISISKKTNPKLNIYIYLCKFTKAIGENHILGFNEINSGVSFTNSWLQIFRLEELYKVLIHELIHNMNLDLNNSISFVEELKIVHMHPESRPIIVNEGYVEAISTYFYAIYISDGSEISVHNILLDEEKFSIYQINKIFKHYSIDNILYFANENNFIQNTNIISYFLLKYLFLINIEYFMRCFDDKTKSTNLIKRSLNKIYQLKIPKISDDNIYDKSLKMVFNTKNSINYK